MRGTVFRGDERMNRRTLQPYPGLRAFERYESCIFFGRQLQVDELLTRLKQHHFLAVTGASGSGKSSLVKAGLLAGLEKGYMGEVGSRWSIAEMRPGGQPFTRLAEALLEDKVFLNAWKPSSLKPSSEKLVNDGEISALTAELRRGSRSLHEILRLSPLPEGTRLLLLVDQFEEIFRFREQEENHATAFVSLLLEACQHKDIYVAITMRSDFLGAAAEFHGLPEAINSGLYLTPRLTRDQLREAICLPAQLFGGSVEELLVNHLLNETGNDPDQLPLLQHALMRLWENDEDKILTLQEYQGLNGLRKALDGHAEQVWEELDPKGQAVVELMFRALTERSRDGQEIRRPLKVQKLLDMTGTDLPTLTKIVDLFRLPGRNFLMPPLHVPLIQDTTLDISHESLIRQWQRLQGWVTAEVKKAAMYQRLLDAAQRYDNEQSELWHGTDLALALEWQAETQPDAIWAVRYEEALLPGSFPRLANDEDKGTCFALTMKFLQKSKAEAERQQRELEIRRERELSQVRQRFLLTFIGFLIAVGLAAWGFTERNHAEKAKLTAQLETKRAIKAEEAAKSEAEKTKIAENNALALVEVTINNLITQENELGVINYIQDVFKSGQKNTLILLLDPLIAKTESMDDNERQYWRDILPQMTDKQIARLVEILFVEKKKLFDLEKKYTGKIEKKFQEDIAKNPKDSNKLFEFAVFMETIRKDYNRAEQLYQQAIAVDPKNAKILGRFAVFMETIRKDSDRAEKLFQQAIAADPKNAKILGNFAIFMKNIRKDYNRAEKLYQQAIAADSKNARNLGNFAIFMQTIRKDYNRAEQLYQQAIAANPKDANSLANFAQLKLIKGDYKNGRALIDRAFAANPEEPALKLELWFYRLAHFPKEYPQAQKEIVSILKTGERDEGWDFSGNIAQAKKDGHANVPLLQAFSDVILNKAKFETLPISAKQ